MQPRGFNFFDNVEATRWLWPEHELHHEQDFVIHTHVLKVMMDKSQYRAMMATKCNGLMPDW